MVFTSARQATLVYRFDMTYRLFVSLRWETIIILICIKYEAKYMTNNMYMYCYKFKYTVVEKNSYSF